MSVLGPLFRWAAVEELLSDRARVQAMLDFEAALARAASTAGIVPPAAAAAIAAQCAVDRYDMEALADGAARAGNLAIPLVARLRALVGDSAPQAARYVHHGATSQDAIDTGMVLQLRRALARIRGELDRLATAVADLVREHRATPIAGRTWMQQAVPTTFGLQLAGWLAALDRHRARLAEVSGRALVLQLGGAVGSLAALGGQGMEVAAALAAELRLGLPPLPWHTHRDRLAEVATTLALCMGTLAKIARDISLHAQTEVGELGEPAGEGRGGSSTMPHKRNPVGSAVVLAAAARVPGLAGSMLGAMAQEQERALGGWQAEWELLPELVSVFAGALHHLTETVAGLKVDTAAMRRNLEATHGLMFAEAVEMALRPRVGLEARRLVEAACDRARSEGRHLREVLAQDDGVAAHLKPEELARLFDPLQYQGVSQELIDRVLAAHAVLTAVPATDGD